MRQSISFLPHRKTSLTIMVFAFLAGARAASAADYYNYGVDGSRIGAATNYSNVDGSTTNATVNPGASDNLFFFNSTAGAGPLDRRLEVGTASLTFNSMTFRNNAGAIQFDRGLTGSSTAVVVSIGSGGLTLDAGAGPVTFGRLADSGNEQRVIVGAVADFSINNNSASDLTFVRDFDGRLNNTTNVITVAGSGSGNTVFAGGIKANTSGRDLAMVINTTGSGVVRIEGTGTYTGGTTLEQGTLQVRGGSALGTGALTINGGTLASYISARTLANDVTVGGNFTLGGSGHATTLNGTIDLGGGTRVITTANSATFGGVVSNGGITKQGSGALTMTASNTFTGTVDVQAGLLSLASATGSAAGGTTNVIVAASATLLIAQSDQVNNTSAVSLSGGTIQRASGASEVFGNLNVSSSSLLDFGSGAAGTLSFGTYTASALLTVNNFFQGNVLTFGDDLSGSINNTNSFKFDNAFTSSWNQGTTTFTITAIPEPSTYVAAAGLLGLLVLSMRRRAASRSPQSPAV